jgi:hypothetical protein
MLDGNLRKASGARRTVPHLAVYTTKAKPKRSFRADEWVSARQARCFSFLNTRVMWRLVHHKWGPVPHINNGKPTSATGWRERWAATPRNGWGLSSIGEAAQLHTGDANQIRNSNPQLLFFPYTFPLYFLRVCIVAKRSTIQTGKLAVSWHMGVSRIRLASKNLVHQIFISFAKEGRNTRMRVSYVVWITCSNLSGLFILKQKQNDHLHKLPPLLPRTVRRAMGN